MRRCTIRGEGFTTHLLPNSRCAFVRFSAFSQNSLTFRFLSKPFIFKDLDGGGGGNRTLEWRFCKPLPYHLATPPFAWRGRQWVGWIHRGVNTWISRICIFELASRFRPAAGLASHSAKFLTHPSCSEPLILYAPRMSSTFGHVFRIHTFHRRTTLFIKCKKIIKKEKPRFHSIIFKISYEVLFMLD